MITFKSKIIELYDYKNIDLSGIIEPFSMSDDELNDKINRIRKKHTVQTDADIIENDDFVTLSCSSDMPKFNKDNIVLRVGAGLFSKELEEKIIGLSTGDKKAVTVDNNDVTIEILKITRRVMPELTDEVVSGYNIDRITTVDELRAYIYNSEKRQYIEENAESVASWISEQAAERSRYELDDEDIAAARTEGYDFALSMIKSMGLDENSGDDEFMEKAGRTRDDFIGFLTELTIGGIFGALVGAQMMKDDGVELTDEQYEAALSAYIEGMGCTEEQAREGFTFRKFETQQASNYYFEKIVEYAENYLGKE